VLHRPRLICATVIGIAIAAFTVPRFGVARVAPGFNPSSITVPVGQQLEQLLAVRAWGLNAIHLRLSDAPSAEYLDVELEPRENGVPMTVIRTTVSLTDVDETLAIRFPPVKSGPFAEFIVRLRPRSASGTGELSFQATEGHAYRRGRLWLDTVELPLDLVLDTDALTARPWPAFAAILHRRTGIAGLEWLFAVAYLGSVCALVRFAASLDTA
jgi:hypothetical protein